MLDFIRNFPAIPQIKRGLVSVGALEERRKLFQDTLVNGTITIRACCCGNRSFHLMSHNTNIKAECTYCGDSQIIAWFPDCGDSSAGAVLDFAKGWRHFDKDITNVIHRRNIQINDLKRKLEVLEKLDRTQFTIRDRLTPQDIAIIRSLLNQELEDDHSVHDKHLFGDTLDHLNTMYPRKQSIEDAEVTGNLCECGHTKQDHRNDCCNHYGAGGVYDCTCQKFRSTKPECVMTIDPIDKGGLIICPNCKAEIAVEDIENYDVDCDCGVAIKPSGDWTRCSCGHIAQQHGNDNRCESSVRTPYVHRCECQKYDGKCKNGHPSIVGRHDNPA